MKITKKAKSYFEYNKIVSVTCDICKQEFDDDDWNKGAYEVLETNVSMKTGYLYPEGGNGDEITFDICPYCFKNKLIPALKELGAHPTESKWDS